MYQFGNMNRCIDKLVSQEFNRLQSDCQDLTNDAKFPRKPDNGWHVRYLCSIVNRPPI